MRNVNKSIVGVVIAVGSSVAFAPATGLATGGPVIAHPVPVPAAAVWESVRIGSSGFRVLQVQHLLRSLGYTLAVDGSFGPQTHATVKMFQVSRGLEVDGVVGPITAAALGLSSGASVPAAEVSDPASIAVKAAMSQIGVGYRFATAQPGVAFDCSGLTKWAWGRAGVTLPHQSAQQYASIRHVPKDQAAPGDLVFSYSPISHVGMYIGNGQMVHARYSGTTIAVTNVRWDNVVGVGRPG